MVHALEQIHGLVGPDGHLIDIHPDGEPVPLIRPLASGDKLIGYLKERDDYIEYRQTDEALETIVASGFFQVERAEAFEFYTYADSFDELKGFLEGNWSDAIIEDELAAQARRLERAHGIGEILLRERARIALLKVL